MEKMDASGERRQGQHHRVGSRGDRRSEDGGEKSTRDPLRGGGSNSSEEEVIAEGSGSEQSEVDGSLRVEENAG